ncbi:MAG: alpha-2-macroglobulin family protein [Firmicutes bacterium]|nr:alpha-2-macroglobulin family protein [Bacillota bacterium]
MKIEAIKTMADKIFRDKRMSALALGGLLLAFFIITGITTIFDRGIKLVSMNPSGEISIKTNLNFIFSADVVTDEEVGITTTEELIKFTPAVPGRFRWVSRRELRFLPEVPFQPSTNYIAEIKPELVKVKERYLAGRQAVSFNTQRFKVNSMNLGFVYPGEQQKGLQLQAWISFNYPVSPAELEKALKIRYQGWGKEIKYNIEPDSASDTFTVTSEPLYPEDKDQKIEVNLAKGFRCIGGNLGLASSYERTAVLGAKKPLTIVEAVPKTDSTKCWISIRCSEPVDAKMASDFIRLKPEMQFKTEFNGEYITIRSEGFKSGSSVNLRIAKGMPSLNGLPLEREYAAGLVFTDLEPSLNFNSPGRYLSSKGFLNLGLETVNIERVRLEISQIYANNIVAYLNNINDDYYAYGGYIKQVGRVVKSTVIDVNQGRNELITTPINLGQYLKDFRGIFQVVAYDDEHYWRRDYKYVIITDLGVVGKMGENELVVWVNSLESLEPKVKAKVSLISRNNQVLASAETDNQGIARFNNIKQLTAGFESFIILAESGDDFSFVHLRSGRIATTDFDVRGRKHLVDGYEAFLYFDRDIFRSGDKGHLVAVIRGVNGAMPPEFPVKLEIRQPDGQIFKELKSNTGDRGACEFTIDLPDYAQTGKYQAELKVAEETIGSAAFSVEEFMPERIKVTAALDKKEYSGGETATIKVEGVNLFGPPAAGRRVELKVRLEPVPFAPSGYESFTFGDSERSFAVKDQELGESKLDEEGLATFNYTFPRGLTPPAKLRSIFHATVIEDGGRAVGSYQVADLHCYDRYIGIKPAAAEYYANINQPYQVKYVVLDKGGQPVDNAQLKVEVYRITWNTIYRRNADGKYEYVSEEEREAVYRGTVAAAKGEQTFEFTPTEYGRHIITLQDAEGSSKAAVSFYASGWGYSPWAMEDPDKIRLETEHPKYRVGEQAKIQIKAPFPGKALVTVEREKVYETRIIELNQNTGIVTIPVKEEYQPNVYVSVHLIRSIKSLEKRAPVRAFGTVPLMVDTSGRRLGIEINAPSQLRPEREYEVALKISGGVSDKTYLTLAAVDEGICQLTNYETPDPNNFFYGKRSLDIESYDLYGMILPEVDPAATRTTPGGGMDDDEIRKQNLNPVAVRRVKPVSLWSGLIKPDRDGQAKVKLKIPQFNGTLRLMAVAMSGNNFGSAQQKVLVRDPIVLTPTFPRFVAPGDQFAAPVGVFNTTGKQGNFQVTLKAEGPVEISGAQRQTVSLRDQEEKQVVFNLKAGDGIGKLVFQLQVSGNNQVCKYQEELSLRPPVPLTHDLASGVITAKEPLTLELNRKWLPGTASYQLILAPLPALKFAGSLQYLLGYPHGCVEQTTSKLFPLLYFDSLAEACESEVFKGGNANYYLAQGIEKLEAMQSPDGGFVFWPGGNYVNEWSSVYTAHFLVEARKAGYTVSDRVYNRMIRYLETLTKNTGRSEFNLQIRTYALYVLSLAGKPQLSAMSYLKNLYLDNLSGYSRAQLAAAYFYAGDRKTARELLPESFTPSAGVRESGRNFNSPVRSDAIILSALADIDPSYPAVYKLIERLSEEAKVGYWGTTQENAYALMALGKIMAQKSEGKYQGEVWAGNTRIATFNSDKLFKLEDDRLGRDKITVKISGTGECYYFMKSSGISAEADLREFDNGLEVRTIYRDRQGRPINTSQIKQGDLVIAQLTITTRQDNLNNIAVVSMLPAGLEIENPRLANNSNFAWMSQRSATPDYMDIRDDRLLLFYSFNKAGEYQFYYALRAVTRGDFVLPPVKAECMYQPELSSIAGSGRISVRE